MYKLEEKKSLLVRNNMFLIISEMIRDFFIFLFQMSSKFVQNLVSLQGFTNGKYLYSWSLIERNVLQWAGNEVALYAFTDRW